MYQLLGIVIQLKYCVWYQSFCLTTSSLLLLIINRYCNGNKCGMETEAEMKSMIEQWERSYVTGIPIPIFERKYYIFPIVLYKSINSLEMWTYRRMLLISWTIELRRLRRMRSNLQLQFTRFKSENCNILITSCGIKNILCYSYHHPRQNSRSKRTWAKKGLLAEKSTQVIWQDNASTIPFCSF